MCGISGVISHKRDLDPIITRMNNKQSHRGPDGNGVYVNNGIALGHVRLSILDLTNAGAQPMRFEQFVISFNGEIYNFQDIRTELQANGYTFSSNSDTEVLIKSWHCWGEECLLKFEGMFSFCILDERNQTLHLCRDAYGVKQVFYGLVDGEFIFASELGTLVDAMPSRPQIDEDAISTFLALHFVPAPATGLKGINKLMPGSTLTVKLSGEQPELQPLRHWGSKFQPSESNPASNVISIDKALAEAVEKQMVSDVPVGAFLSGGVDSSLICYYAAKARKEKLHTFSIGFSDVGKEHDETTYAKQAAETINSIHHPIQIELNTINENIFESLSNIEELNADTSVFLTDLVCEEAKKDVTVCLSGAGGDELFAGYFRHQALLALGYLSKIPEPLINTLQTGLSFLPQHRDSTIGNFSRRLNQFLHQRNEGGNFVSMLRNDNLFTQQSSFLSENHVNNISDALAFDFRHFLGDNILSFTDKMSMKHSLEVRVPFLDPELIKVAAAMPMSQQISLFEKKKSLKKLAARYFPREIIYRKKQGFSAPLEIWMRKLTLAELTSMCSDGIASKIVPESLIAKLASGFMNDRADFSTQLYALIVLNKWGKAHQV